MNLDIDAIKARAEQYAKAIGPGGEKALAEVERLRAELADPRRLRMYHDSYMAIGRLMDKALGPNEEEEVELVVAQRDQARAENKRLTAERDEALRERDLAITHDRQPYPTADAYEHACDALHKHRRRADLLNQRMRAVQLRVNEFNQSHNATWVKEFLDGLLGFVCGAVDEDNEARNCKPERGSGTSMYDDRLSELWTEVKALRAQVARDRPVLDAARVWRATWSEETAEADLIFEERLVAAVDGWKNPTPDEPHSPLEEFHPAHEGQTCEEYEELKSAEGLPVSSVEEASGRG